MNKLTSGAMCFIEVTGKYAGNFPVLVDDHIEDEIGAGPLRYADAVFVKRVAVKDAVCDLGMVDHLEGVHEFHGFKTGNSREYGFAASRVTGIEMRFNQACQNFEIGV